MIHRHINPQHYTLAAIDDIIARGRRADWETLRQAVAEDPALIEKIKRVCQPHLADPFAQRYFFWNHYVQRRTA
jgi:hypothetical protein